MGGGWVKRRAISSSLLYASLYLDGMLLGTDSEVSLGKAASASGIELSSEQLLRKCNLPLKVLRGLGILSLELTMLPSSSPVFLWQFLLSQVQSEMKDGGTQGIWTQTSQCQILVQTMLLMSSFLWHLYFLFPPVFSWLTLSLILPHDSPVVAHSTLDQPSFLSVFFLCSVCKQA